MPSKPTSLFVVGPFRSGTSLLYAVLNQHPQISLMYECNVWDFPEALSGLRFRNDWRGRLEFYNGSLSRHRLIFGESLQGLEDVHHPDDLYRVFAKNKEATVYGEKSPFYCNRLRHLARNHPGCSFILIWRDPLEIQRSVEDAAKKSHFFRRRGILNRLIFYQEQMIHEATALARAGHRVHHLTYSSLIDRTEETCRGICEFLKIDFDARMLDLNGADLTAVFRAPQHDYLRHGKIERRQFSPNGKDTHSVQKLQRFRNRWNRLGRGMFQHPQDGQMTAEPPLLECLYHRLAGLGLSTKDDFKRTLFEFLPLPWLRTYRQAKSWFLGGRARSGSNGQSLGQEFLANKVTIFFSIVLLTIVAAADYFTGAAVSLMPFYMIPAAVLSLIINQRWGTFGAALSAITWALLQNFDNQNINFSHPAIWVWDLVMRFLALEVIVLLLGRIRLEVNSQKVIDD